MGRYRNNPGRSPLKGGWLLALVVIVFTLSIGAAVHNHGLFGSDGGAEKVSQSKFTCPACVFDGKPITLVACASLIGDFGRTVLVEPAEIWVEAILGEAASSRAPPAV